MKTEIPILKMLPNRVRRNYLGGAVISNFRGLPAEDGDKPEEWLCSTVEAKNPGLEVVQNEGLSQTEIASEKYIFVDILKDNPQYYLNNSAYHSLSFLAKWLDSSIRLHMQAHPTRDFSRKYLGCDYGKFEAYYVLGIREDVKEPYIRLGFQRKDITKEIWKKIVEAQDIGEMDSCFEKIPIKKGDVIYIPGGMPHAIGEGVFMLEMMEPSDLVVRCEFSREGIIVPPEARFMGKGIDFCMNIFDYTYHSKEDILRNFFLTPEPIHKESNVLIERLVPGSISGCFETERITIHNGHSEINLDNRYAVLLCTKGNGTVESGDYAYPVSLLDSFFIAANTQKISVTTTEEIELCLIKPTH